LYDAAEGGSSKEMAFVLVGEPGNGKTFFVDYLCDQYRKFLSRDKNRKYTFKFNKLDKIGSYGRITTVESQTYEDPMILAMNLFDDRDETAAYLSRDVGFSDEQLERLYKNYRPLGACSGYIWNDIRSFTGGDLKKMLDFVEIVPVPLTESLGTITGKYPAKDKITSSAVDLLGEESIQRLLHITDTNNPYRFDLRRGALARVAGGGVHFSDEIYKNKKDLVQVYLGVIQNRNIEIDGYKWPIDTLIIATSNNSEFNRFLAEKEEAPIVDRCRICYVSHNANYKLQQDLTKYAIGNETKTTLSMEDLHQDPNLNYAASVAVTLTRLPRSEKLTPIETMKLAAGEVAGEKSIKTLAEVIDTLNQDPDITKRFGQKGLGQRNLGRALQLLVESSETNEGRCMFAFDIFKALERVVPEDGPWHVATTPRPKCVFRRNGLAILSVHPIVAGEFRAFRSSAFPDLLVNKGVLKVTVELPGRGRVNVWNVHLQSQGAERTRAEQIEELIGWVEEADEGQVLDLIAGDFNCLPGSVHHRRLCEAFGSSVRPGGSADYFPTWDGLSDDPSRAKTLDYVFIRKRAGAGRLQSRTEPAFTAAAVGQRCSDHLGVMAELEFGRAPGLFAGGGPFSARRALPLALLIQPPRLPLK